MTRLLLFKYGYECVFSDCRTSLALLKLYNVYKKPSLSNHGMNFIQPCGVGCETPRKARRAVAGISRV